MTDKKAISGPMTVTLQPNEVICRAGDEESDLFIVHSGKLLVFVVNGTQITPLAYLTDGEYLGELSFFDHKPRSAYVVAVEETTLIQIPTEELDRQFPPWLILMARHITKKLRETDELIRKKGLRKQNVETIKPLSIEEQRHYLGVIGGKV
jgi:CRP/FNR family transcriptional regulator, cyclic AMP receptor protein